MQQPPSSPPRPQLAAGWCARRHRARPSPTPRPGCAAGCRAIVVIEHVRCRPPGPAEPPGGACLPSSSTFLAAPAPAEPPGGAHSLSSSTSVIAAAPNPAPAPDVPCGQGAGPQPGLRRVRNLQYQPQKGLTCDETPTRRPSSRRRGRVRSCGLPARAAGKMR